MVINTFSPSTQGWGGWGRGRGRQISEFEASLAYRVNSRKARATQRNLVSKNQRPNQKEKERGGGREEEKKKEKKRKKKKGGL
jgi:hypothetical protein